MKLSDVVSSMHLTIYAEVPLLIFMGIFVGVCLSLLGQKSDFEQTARLALHSEKAARRRR